jgi:hypothetical protein
MTKNGLPNCLRLGAGSGSRQPSYRPGWSSQAKNAAIAQSKFVLLAHTIPGFSFRESLDFILGAVSRMFEERQRKVEQAAGANEPPAQTEPSDRQDPRLRRRQRVLIR